MFATMNNGTSAYATVGVETGVAAANPHKLILMLFEGAISMVATAKLHMQQRETAAKGEAISKAIDIIANGLNASLDRQAGGEMAGNLAALYDYMCGRLLHANLRNDQAALDEVARLLRELRSAWEEIAADPAVLSANQAAA
jgi:flagellar protein FliS